MSESKRADDRFNLIAMLVFLPIAAILKVYFFSDNQRVGGNYATGSTYRIRGFASGAILRRALSSDVLKNPRHGYGAGF